MGGGQIIYGGRVDRDQPRAAPLRRELGRGVLTQVGPIGGVVRAVTGRSASSEIEGRLAGVRTEFQVPRPQGGAGPQPCCGTRRPEQTAYEPGTVRHGTDILTKVKVGPD